MSLKVSIGNICDYNLIYNTTIMKPTSESLRKASKLMEKMPSHKVMLNPKSYRMAHPVYSETELNEIKVTHRERKTIKDKLAYGGLALTRYGFDLISGYNPDKMNVRNWLNRIVFLETVAGIPGMVGGMHRHLTSLRKLERDHGWIHHLL